MFFNPRLDKPFIWPNGKKGAVTLTFDDARSSQTEVGIPILNDYGIKATFFVNQGGLEQELEKWGKAVEAGHEMGNHTQNHPCSGNYGFNRDSYLEDYTLDRMEAELLEANETIKKLLGVTPNSFAYPCGQTFVGRGTNCQSYVQVVAKHFLVGRSAFDESINNPWNMDLAQTMGLDMDMGNFDALKAMVDGVHRSGGWLCLFGHGIGAESASQTLSAGVLKQLCEYMQDPANEIWVNTAAAIGTHIKAQTTAV